MPKRIQVSPTPLRDAQLKLDNLLYQESVAIRLFEATLNLIAQLNAIQQANLSCVVLKFLVGWHGKPLLVT